MQRAFPARWKRKGARMTNEHARYAIARQGKRASYERADLDRILGAGTVGHVGFVSDGRPMVMPMAYGRIGDIIYLHGARITRLIADNAKDAPMCLTVTMVDGLVVARSAFHHSMNYRCAVVHGRARLIDDAEASETALRAITEHLLPGRWNEIRPVKEKERKATGVLALSMDAFSVKMRRGGPIEEAGDEGLPFWGGVLLMHTVFGAAEPDEHVAPAIPLPALLEAARHKLG